MKQQVQVFLFMRKTEKLNKDTLQIETVWVPDLWTFKPPDTEIRVFVCEQTVALDVPDDFDPLPKQVAALEAEKRAAMDAYKSKVAEINDKLSKLQALEFTS